MLWSLAYSRLVADEEDREQTAHNKNKLRFMQNWHKSTLKMEREEWGELIHQSHAIKGCQMMVCGAHTPLREKVNGDSGEIAEFGQRVE